MSNQLSEAARRAAKRIRELLDEEPAHACYGTDEIAAIIDEELAREKEAK